MIGSEVDFKQSNENKQDLIHVLRLRFGTVPSRVLNAIHKIRSECEVDRLVLVAANVRSLPDFLEELGAQGDTFKISGDKYDPIVPSEA